MPYQYKIDATAGVAMLTLYGSVSGTELIRGMRELFGDSAFAYEMAVIYEALGITELVLRPEEAKPLVGLRDEYGGGVRGPAVFVIRRDLDREIATMFAHMARQRGHTAHVVETMEEALGTLGLDELPPAWRTR